MTGFESKREAAADKLQEPVVKVVSTAPKHIWLDIGFNPQDEAEVAFHELYDVTWSEDNASGYGIEYVRADITPPQPAQEPTSGDYALGYSEGFNDACKKPAQEPVAWMCHPFGDDEVEYGPHKECENCTPLYTTPPQRERVVFPTMLRKMWSGGEVQAWLDENVNKEKNNGT